MQALPFDLIPPSPSTDTTVSSRSFLARSDSSKSFGDHLQRASGPRSNSTTRDARPDPNQDNDRRATADNTKQQAAKLTDSDTTDDRSVDVSDEYMASSTDTEKDDPTKDKATDPQTPCPTPAATDEKAAQSGSGGAAVAGNVKSETETGVEEKIESEPVLDLVDKAARKPATAAKTALGNASKNKESNAEIAQKVVTAVAKDAVTQCEAEATIEENTATLAASDVETVATSSPGNEAVDPSTKPAVTEIKETSGHAVSSKVGGDENKSIQTESKSGGRDNVVISESDESSFNDGDSQNSARTSDKRGAKIRVTTDDAQPVQQFSAEHKPAEIARQAASIAPVTSAPKPVSPDTTRPQQADRTTGVTSGINSAAPAAANINKPQSSPPSSLINSLNDSQSPTSLGQKPAARPEAVSKFNEVDRVRFVQRVARAVQTAGDRGGEVRMRISPPQLGSLKLEVVVRGGVMSARVEAETSAARALLIDNLPALRERLAEQNIKIDQFDVDLSGGSSGSLPDRTAGNPNLHSQREAAMLRSNRTNEPVIGDTAKPVAPQTRVFRDGSLNVIV